MSLASIAPGPIPRGEHASLHLQKDEGGGVNNPDLKALDSSRKNIAAGPYPTQRGTHRSIARKDGGVGLTSRPQGSRHQWRRSRGRTRIEIEKKYRCRSIPPPANPSLTSMPIYGIARDSNTHVHLPLSERVARDGATLLVGFGLARNFDPQRPAQSMRPSLASSPKHSWSRLTGTIGSTIRLRAALGSRRCWALNKQFRLRPSE